MSRAILISFLLIYLVTKISGQNLIPDGSFESIIAEPCQHPKDVFQRSTSWYPVQGTPDLFNNNCPLPSMSEIFWSEGSSALEGNNYIGLRTRVNTNQTYNSEGVAIKLSQPILAGKSYIIKLNFRNKGIYQGFPAALISCPLKPEKKIELYTHSDSIIVTNDFTNGTASCNGQLAGHLTSEIMKSDEISDSWNQVGTCFINDEDANYFSLQMPLGNFGTFPACAAEDTKGTFYSYYYEIDKVSIEPLPQQIDTTIYIQEDQDANIYLPEDLDLNFLDDVVYEWSDGYIGSRRSIRNEGEYQVIANLNCGEIYVNITIVRKGADFPVFVPNAFSPNNDGINDEFQIYVPDNVEVIKFEIRIFDRWGNSMFYSDDPKKSWEVANANYGISSGEYIYKINCTLKDESGIHEYQKTGTIALFK